MSIQAWPRFDSLLESRMIRTCSLHGSVCSRRGKENQAKQIPLDFQKGIRAVIGEVAQGSVCCTDQHDDEYDQVEALPMPARR